MSTTMSKQADVLAAHAGQVLELAKHHPDKGEAELRRMAWETRPDLQRRWNELPAEGRSAAAVAPGAGAAGAPQVQKGADVLQKHAAAVAQLRTLHPEKPERELRKLAWESRPDLRREYNAAQGSPFA